MTRSRIAIAIAVLSAAVFVVALVLVHGGGHQTLPGSRVDPTNPDASGEPVQVRVECASSAYGSRLDDGSGKSVDDPDGEDILSEDDFYGLGQRSIELAEVSDACGRERTERLTLAVELAFLGLLLGGWAVLVSRGRTWDPIDRTPLRDRPDDGAVL